MVIQGDNHCDNDVIGDVSYLELDLYDWGCDCWQVQPLGQIGGETEDIDVVFCISHGCRIASYTSGPSQVNRSVDSCLLIQALHCQ